MDQTAGVPLPPHPDRKTQAQEVEATVQAALLVHLEVADPALSSFGTRSKEFLWLTSHNLTTPEPWCRSSR